MQRLLDYQADRIEQILSAHKVPGRVLGGVVTPRWIRFEVVPALGARIDQMVRLSEEIALWLGSRGVRVRRDGGRVHIEVPREEGDMVQLLPLMARLGDIPRHTAVLGLDEAGIPLLLRLPSPDVCHVLVAGTTGCGKTALVRSMIFSLALNNRPGRLQVVIIDPKGRGYGALERLPHLLRPVVREADQAIKVLDELVRRMIQRDREGVQEPRLVVVIDEMADLAVAAGATFVQMVTRLSQRGREAGIHVIGCTQKPTVEAIGSLVKSNFPVRLVGSVASPEDARVATGLRASGAEKLLGRGDFLLVVKGEIIRFQAAYISTHDAAMVIETLQQQTGAIRCWSPPIQVYDILSSGAA
ncbi:MAG: DNA translocase FtsK [Anaerolineae bacterium]|nr:DNA translocase FtsK [Anaerolineae bacterium]MDW8071773.1 DNA translocase FtsK [Anaerolineae bacterium]